MRPTKFRPFASFVSFARSARSARFADFGAKGVTAGALSAWLLAGCAGHDAPYSDRWHADTRIAPAAAPFAATEAQIRADAVAAYLASELRQPADGAWPAPLPEEAGATCNADSTTPTKPPVHPDETCAAYEMPYGGRYPDVDIVYVIATTPAASNASTAKGVFRLDIYYAMQGSGETAGYAGGVICMDALHCDQAPSVSLRF